MNNPVDAIQFVMNAIVESGWAALPKFNFRWAKAVATPVFWTWWRIAKLCLKAFFSLFQKLAIRDGCALWGGPSANT